MALICLGAQTGGLNFLGGNHPGQDYGKEAQPMRLQMHLLAMEGRRRSNLLVTFPTGLLKQKQLDHL